MEKVVTNHNIIKRQELNDVIFFESVGSYTRKYCNSGREYLINSNLDNVHEMLPRQKFFKINESFIINADYLKKIKIRIPKKVLLCGGIELNVAPNKYRELINFLRYKFNIW